MLYDWNCAQIIVAREGSCPPSSYFYGLISEAGYLLRPPSAYFVEYDHEIITILQNISQPEQR